MGRKEKQMPEHSEGEWKIIELKVTRMLERITSIIEAIGPNNRLENIKKNLQNALSSIKVNSYPNEEYIEILDKRIKEFE